MCVCVFQISHVCFTKGCFQLLAAVKAEASLKAIKHGLTNSSTIAGMKFDSIGFPSRASQQVSILYVLPVLPAA